jgi:topoisomerase-4 subunit B
MFKNKWYSVGFKKGKLTSLVTQLNKAPNGPNGKPLKSGTCIHFKPDSSIFSVKTFPASMVTEWAEIMSYLNPGFAIISSNSKGRTVYLSKEGTQEYVAKRIDVLKATMLNPKVFEYKSELADIIVSFTNHDGCDIRGFTSGLSNPDGGTHVASVNTALYEGLKLALIKAKKKPLFSIADFKEGLVGLINAKLHKAQYSSQDKSKLTDARTGLEFCKLLTVEATTFFNKNKELALTLFTRATQLNELKTSFNKSKKLVNALGVLKRKGLPVEKYAAPSKSTKVADRELIICEGLSAAGGLKMARFPYQAVLAMRGKVMNACKQGAKTLESEEITYILSAIGFDPKASDPYERLQVGKVILMADSDEDGGHISVLLLALFYKYLPKLFEMGMVYVADTPEFYAQHKSEIYFGPTLSSVNEKIKQAKAPSSLQVNHIKGWGEVSAQLLRMLAMASETRTLIQIKQLDVEDRDFDKLMNDDVTYRKELLGITE